ncbi:3-hydroxyacyl-CoA dehydrogenase NAD-binding domain-containing protein [Pontibacter sp. G13]|uniref:3-hydroxyacyl-CoA dehydrogenase/enoyl-CoA hydratase family protein n=1 Tax=Pontibacter sp. G13 TaxID=3074898 RepID=UPI002889CB2B|nr:3-hydroxyacyl-CoA dehydrogenase NAD-binding domain-containing protein [Pontibacter sp. G13]WNJ16223.1 3-hydroxyacyl-CoA dehydrogenase NAD-binding domain-containing protein [Pontibacter sp. G13]
MQVAEQATTNTSTRWHRNIKRVAVLGSGVMGSRIACHFANTGVQVLLLDIVPKELTEKEAAKGLTLAHPAVRNRIVNEALTAAVKGKPAALYNSEDAALIETGNFDDDFEKIAECDWILEAVVERLDIKKIIFEKVDNLRKEGSIITTNTSGIPIHMIQEGRSEDFRKHFLGTHFFNPPRYLRLLEIIPGPDTEQGLVDFMMNYGSQYLGKKTVTCKDTPAFIANRIGIYAIAKIFQLVKDMGLTIEEVDKLTGTATGKPKSGTFRLSDLVGLDTTVHVLNGLKQNCPNDEENSLFEVPPFVQTMLDNKWLGDKTKQGFYKKTRNEKGEREILSLDLETLEYRPKAKVSIPSLKLVKNTSSLAKRLKLLFKAEDKGGEFVRRSSLGIWAYVSNRIPEIADALYQIDDAVNAGFGWDKGPFETWDMVGVAETMAAFEAEGLKPAPWVQEMLDAGISSFYKVENGVKSYYDINTKSYQPIPGASNFLILENIKEEKTIWSNSDASIIDLGDGVLNVEFHSKMNSIGEGIIKAIHHAIQYAEDNSYNGVVVANEAPNFSVGANIMLMLMMASQGEWEELNLAVRTFQNTSMRMRYSAVPVVVAPHGMTLGGGCEFTLHSDVAVANAETYIGLVEVGVGLIPGGGGTKEMALRAADEYSQPGAIGVGVLEKYLMNIATAKVATSAAEAHAMKIFRDTDKVAINPDLRIKEAKEAVLALAEAGYTQPTQRKDIPVLGRNTLSTLLAAIGGMRYGHYISEHDAKIATKLAEVMCGGNLSGANNKVSEQYLLDIEREAFLSLAGEKKTMERMQHMLQTGKPLRN